MAKKEDAVPAEDGKVRDEDIKAVFEVMIAQVENRAKSLGHSAFDSQGKHEGTSSAWVTSKCATCKREGFMRTGEEPSGLLVIERCTPRP